MSNHIFYIVDVFTKEKYAGNQLAVIRCKKEISNQEMQKIAREINFSETSFILSEEKRNKGYDVKIFTPEAEIPFAGHPTLGTAYIIQSEINKTPIKELNLNLQVGQIPVKINYANNMVDILWMEQIEPVFGKIFESNTILDVLNLNKNDLDERFPIQEVSTGLPHIIIPLKSLKSIKRARVNKEKYFDLVNKTKAKAFLPFCKETYDANNDLNVRQFADFYGIPEDPATGSGNGCLAGYLIKHNYFNKDNINVRVEQGYEIGRKALLFLDAKKQNGKINVKVGGNVVL
ncbi:MAG TPA: PhzF family phenazine biosynthesis protein, partial [Candidatus Lokiarchaeia archaeon]